MLEIGIHIERLLLEHDCVVVPEWGGFVLHSVSASYDEKERVFIPRRKEVVFNATLRHNDGLLAESYMQKNKVDYRRAQLMIEEDVAKMRAALQEEKVLLLGALGSFSLGQEGQVVFHPGETVVFSAGSYGLEPFSFPRLQPKHYSEDEDTVYIPISRRFVRTAAVSAAAVALFLLVSTPVRDVETSAYTASFAPMEMTKGNDFAAKPTETVAEEAEMPVAEVAEVAVVAEVKMEQPVEMPAPEPARKMYHIVIGSFPTESGANKFMAGVSREDYGNADLIVRDGKYRVYADKFDNRKDAESYLASLRSRGQYNDAWLFISR